MLYDLKDHNSLIYSTIETTISSIVPSFNVLLKENVSDNDSNPLVEFLKEDDIDVNASQISDALMECELDYTTLIHTTVTPYSTIRVYGLSGLKASVKFKMFIIEFEEVGNPTVSLRCGVVCEWNLATEFNINIDKTTEESINTANFILCELIHMASELTSGTESGI